MKGQELCDAYLAEIRRVRGDECADKSEVYHDQGWYYVKIAREGGDGSWKTWGTPRPFRAHDIIHRVMDLQERLDYETRQSRLAETGEVEFPPHIFVRRRWREQTDTYEVSLSVPSRLIKGVSNMRDFRDTVIEAVKVAREMRNEQASDSGSEQGLETVDRGGRGYF